MSWWSKLRGTTEPLFQLGLGGPQWKANAGILEGRDPADSAFARVRGGTPIGADDLTSKAYVDGKIQNAGADHIDFGAPPGSSIARTVIVGQALIVGGLPASASKVMAWLDYSATADHTDDEHLLSGIEVRAGNIVTGVGFDIVAFASRGHLSGQYNVLWSWQL